jgi:hypothetical protein
LLRLTVVKPNTSDSASPTSRSPRSRPGHHQRVIASRPTCRAAQGRDLADVAVFVGHAHIERRHGVGHLLRAQAAPKGVNGARQTNSA